MDGGGRYLQPMTAYPAGLAVARATSSTRSQLPPESPRFSAPRMASGRRRSVAVPLERRMPALPREPGSTLGFFAAVTVLGLWQGGHLDDFIRQHGEPHHALARAFGLGLEQVTISGIAQMRESEVLAAAGLDSEAVARLPRRERRARAPRAGAADQERLGSQALSERAGRSRSPSASPMRLWQLNGELFVIAADGTVIDLMQDERFVDLPLRGRRARQSAHTRITSRCSKPPDR